jgi:hypothetical protein
MQYEGRDANLVLIIHRTFAGLSKKPVLSGKRNFKCLLLDHTQFFVIVVFFFCFRSIFVRKVKRLNI